MLCLVDDAHWLDKVSAEALLFVARRLDAEGIVMLFAAREGEVRGFEAGDLPSLLVERLDPEASATLLARVASSAAPSVRERLIEQTQGNALALVELPSALSEGQLAGDEPLPEALPLTSRVESIFLERVRRLPDEAQRVLLGRIGRRPGGRAARRPGGRGARRRLARVRPRGAVRPRLRARKQAGVPASAR